MCKNVTKNLNRILSLILTIVAILIIPINCFANNIFLNPDIWESNENFSSKQINFKNNDLTIEYEFKYSDNLGVASCVNICSNNKDDKFINNLNPKIAYYVANESNKYNNNFIISYDKTISTNVDEKIIDYGCNFNQKGFAKNLISYVNFNNINRDSKIKVFIILEDRRFLLINNVSLNDIYYDITTTTNKVSGDINNKSTIENNTKDEQSTITKFADNTPNNNDANNINNNNNGQYNNDNKYQNNSSVNNFNDETITTNNPSHQTIESGNSINNSKLSLTSWLVIILGIILIIMGIIITVISIIKNKKGNKDIKKEEK